MVHVSVHRSGARPGQLQVELRHFRGVSRERPDMHPLGRNSQTETVGPADIVLLLPVRRWLRGRRTFRVLVLLQKTRIGVRR